ncbi:MAG: metallophosphoesterase [Methyloligellaceae bacterium]
MQDSLRELFFWRSAPVTESLTAEPEQLDGKLRVADTERPIELDLAGRILRLYPEFPIDPAHAAPRDWRLVDVERCFREVCGFATIRPGESLLVGRDNERLHQLFGFTSAIRNRHLEIENDAGRLTFRRLDPDAETVVSQIDEPSEVARPLVNRRNNLQRVRSIFGGLIELLSPEPALAALRQVNQILGDEEYRVKDASGRPGGLVNLPGELLPIIVGDLHAQVDNLLKILSEDSYLEALCRGEACLILLGDNIHSEVDGELEQMDTSLLMLDLIFKLKIRFPDHVVCLRGNHESFEADVGKDGVPQGILFRKRVRELRGQSYADELETFFGLLPYVVKSSDFIACHGGPPRGGAALQDLIGIADHPDLAHALTWNRLKGPRAPLGYRKKDVKRFRAMLGAEKKTPLIVAHNPLSQEETVWTDAGEITNHHIVFSAHQDRLALFTRIGEHLLPLEYPAESLLAFANALELSVADAVPSAAM